MNALETPAPATPLLAVDALVKHYPGRRRGLRPAPAVRAVDGVDLHLHPGETLALVGESGCGKTTLARCVVRAMRPTSGRVRLALPDGRALEVASARGEELRRARRDLQMVFQDPHASLNARMTVGAIVAEPLRCLSTMRPAQRRERVREVLHLVGLPSDAATRYPHAFSGGQRQRIGIARALSVDPRLVVLDEAVSALDVSVQAQVLNVLLDLQSQLGVAYLFVSHDLAVVRHVADRIAVMYLGHVVEEGPRDAVTISALHPYTQLLMGAALIVDAPRRERTARQTGEVPDPSARPSGCPFHPRCPLAEARCRVERPRLLAAQGASSGHRVACHAVPTDPSPKETAHAPHP